MNTCMHFTSDVFYSRPNKTNSNDDDDEKAKEKKKQQHHTTYRQQKQIKRCETESSNAI